MKLVIANRNSTSGGSYGNIKGFFQQYPQARRIAG